MATALPREPQKVERRAAVTSSPLSVGAYTPFPLILQQCAPRTVRRHGWGSVLRVSALAAADVVALGVARLLLRGVGDQQWLGGTIAHLMRELIPRGTYPVLPTVSAIVLGLLALGTYGPGDNRRDPSRIASGVLLAVGLMYWTHLWSATSLLGITGFVVTTCAVIALVVSSRALVDLVARRYRIRVQRASRTLLVGTKADLDDAWRLDALRDEAEFNVVGELQFDALSREGANESVEQLVRAIDRDRVDTVIVVGSVSHDAFGQLLSIVDCAGCTVYALPRVLGRGEFEPTLIWRRGQPLVQITKPALRAWQLLLKRILDVVVASCALVVLSPIFAVIAVAIRLDSTGPVFFRQERVGRGGRRFQILKFRSMSVGAEQQLTELKSQSLYQDARLFKMPRDPRTTRVGSFLRRRSLDELPQLINVVLGQMSLVGPRPPVPQEVALYDEHHYARFEMRPGITGPWQVNGRNNITEFERVVDLEVAYMRHWSIWKDLAILARTIPVVVRMDGAH